MKAMKLISAVLTLLIYLPLWYYIMYSILCAIHPDRLLWFLFWIYLPVGFLVSLLGNLIDSARKE